MAPCLPISRTCQYSSSVSPRRPFTPSYLAAVNDVEGLTTALPGKIWQKIMILDRKIAPEVELE